MFNFFNKTPSISVQDTALKILGDNTRFIDVRSRAEYNGGHARGAQNIPLETIDLHANELKSFREVYVICQSGGRSAQAVNHLLAQGVNALNVSGGTSAWQSEGLPVEK